MRTAVARCVGLVRASVLGVCTAASACHAVPPAPVSSPSLAPAAPPEPQPEPTLDAGLAASPQAPPDSTEPPDAPVAAPAPSVAEKEQPRDGTFGVPLAPGLYTFPDGLRLRFSATHECEYDSTEPCSPFDVEAWFKGQHAKLNVLPGNSVRIVRYKVQVTDQALVVRK